MRLLSLPGSLPRGIGINLPPSPWGTHFRSKENPMRLTPPQTLARLLDTHLPAAAAAEGLDPDAVRTAVRRGAMVLLANPAHPEVRPTLVGRPARIKVNANIGTSPLACDPAGETAKLREAEDAGADTVMDLSTGGDLDAIRLDMLRATPLPLGTVPLYALARKRAPQERIRPTSSPRSSWRRSPARRPRAWTS